MFGSLRAALTYSSALVAISWAGAVAAQPPPAGPELRLETDPVGYQFSAQAAGLPGGGFVVVWISSGGSVGSDDPGHGVVARRFDAAGAPLDPVEFQVNTYTTSYQTDSAVAADGSGRFVVVWESDGSHDTDDDSWSIQARRYAADGQPLGDEFQVNVYTTASQTTPAVAATPSGEFVVVWDSYGSSGTDPSGYSVQARRFDADGEPAGEEFQVNSYTTDLQLSPAVAIDATGRFVVAWASGNPADPDSWEIRARRFDADGQADGEEFEVSSHDPDQGEFGPEVALDSTGSFVVAWTSRGSPGNDGDGLSVQARLFDGNGQPRGDQFQVNSYTTSYQALPSVDADGQGRFLVVWQSTGSFGDDTDAVSAQARQFGFEGGPGSPEFQVNSFTPGFQYFPVLARGSGATVAVWSTQILAVPAFDRSMIRAQRFATALFADGFESGDTGGWSSIVP